MTRLFLFLLFLVSAQPVVAQQSVSTGSPPAEEPGLSGSVSDDADWQNQSIAIPAFATNADVPTQTSAGKA